MVDIAGGGGGVGPDSIHIVYPEQCTCRYFKLSINSNTKIKWRRIYQKRHVLNSLAKDL